MNALASLLTGLVIAFGLACVTIAILEHRRRLRFARGRSHYVRGWDQPEDPSPPQLLPATVPAPEDHPLAPLVTFTRVAYEGPVTAVALRLKGSDHVFVGIARKHPRDKRHDGIGYAFAYTRALDHARRAGIRGPQ